MLVRTRRQPIWVERLGSGPPLLLLHPLALSSLIWAELAGRLAGSFEVWLVDLRGHGRTPWDGLPFSLEDMAADVLALLDETDTSSVSMLGMSMGGGVAMTVAGLQPARVDGLVLADTTAWYGPTATSDWEARARSALESPRQALLPFQVNRWFGETFRRERPDVVEAVCSVFVQTDREAHAQACRALGAFDARALLGSITARTLILVGDGDYATPVAYARDLAEAIPSSRLEVLEGLRHFSLVEAPEVAGKVAAHLLDTTCSSADSPSDAM